MNEESPTPDCAASPAGSEMPGSQSTAVYGREFWLIFAATFVLNLVMNLLVLYPLYIVKLGGGASSIGAIIGTGSLAALLSRPGASSAITQYGRRWTALQGLLLNGLAMLLLIPLKSIGWAIYTVTAIAGIANGAARVALFAMVFDILPAGRRGETMSIFSLSGMGPATFAALAGEEVLKLWGFTTFFAIAGALSIVAAATVMMVRDDRPARVTSVAEPIAIDENVASYRALLTDPSLLLLWIITLLFGLALSTRNSFVAPFGVAEDIANVGWYFTIYSVVAAAVRLNGRLMDRVGLERMLLPSLLVNGIGISLVSLTGMHGMLYIAAAIGGLGHGFTYPALSALVIKHTQPSAMGRSSTIYTSIWDLSAMAGPYMFGAMAHYAGYALMFVAAGAFSMIGSFYLAAMEPRALGRRLA